MPRTVSPWTWAIALREHGPTDKITLLVLLILRTFMDKQGYAWPGRNALAAGARIHVKTVQRHLSKAQAAGWIHVEAFGRFGGQRWRSSTYRATVPDWVQMSETDEKLADALVAEVGEAGSDTESPPYGKGGSRAVTPPLGAYKRRSAEAGSAAVPKVGALDAKLRTFSAKLGAPESPTNSSSELFIQNSSHTRSADADRRDKDRGPEQAKIAEHLALLTAPKFPSVGEPRGLAGKADTDRPRRIRAYAANLPDQSAGQIAHAFNCGIEEVRQALAGGNP